MSYAALHNVRVRGCPGAAPEPEPVSRAVKAGQELVVTEHGREVARLIPIAADAYAELAAVVGASVPTGRLERVAERLRAPGAPAGTTDASLAESRGERSG
jgi:prevent-host-death family protein